MRVVMVLVMVTAVLDDEVGHERRPARAESVRAATRLLMLAGSILAGATPPDAGRHGRRLPVEQQIPVRIVRHPGHV